MDEFIRQMREQQEIARRAVEGSAKYLRENQVAITRMHDLVRRMDAAVASLVTPDIVKTLDRYAREQRQVHETIERLALPHQIWTREAAAISSPSCPKIQTNSRLARQAVSIVIAPWRVPDLGRVGGDVGDSGSPYAQGKHRPATGCHAPGRRPGSRPGPHLDQNVLGQLRCGSLGLDSGSLGWPLFRRRAALSAARHPIWRKRGTRKSGLVETNAENEARSALLARLW